VYSGAFKQCELAFDARFKFYEAPYRQNAFEYKIATATCPTTPDLSRMNDQELDEYSHLLAQSFAASLSAKQRLRVYETVNCRLLNDFDTAVAIEKDRQAVLLSHPDHFPIPTPGTPAGPQPSQPLCR
jgi:hypothetical protein